MKNVHFTVIILVVITLLNSGCQNSSDWPGWRGPDRDGKVVGFEIPEVWPESLSESWKVIVGEADASPILIKNKLYLHTKLDSMETALCVDAENGELIWKTAINPAPEVTGGGRSHPGPRSTPSFVDGKILTLGADGIFSCLDAKTGSILWKNTSYTFEIPKFYTSVSPLIKDDMCVMHLGGHEKGVIVAFEVESGEEIWKIEGEPCTYSSPIIWKADPEIIIIQTETDLLGISFDGEILMRIPTPIKGMASNSSTPFYTGNTLYSLGHGRGTIAYSIHEAEGNYSFTELWSNNDYGVSFCTPVIKDGFLYTVGTRKGILYSLNATTGELAWADTVKLNAFASVFDLGEILVTSPASGELIFFAPNSEEYEELAKYQISESKVYASPVFSGNKIFTKDETTLSCWEVK